MKRSREPSRLLHVSLRHGFQPQAYLADVDQIRGRHDGRSEEAKERKFMHHFASSASNEADLTSALSPARAYAIQSMRLKPQGGRRYLQHHRRGPFVPSAHATMLHLRAVKLSSTPPHPPRAASSRASRNAARHPGRSLPRLAQTRAVSRDTCPQG